jgi:hypothetical protein
VKGNFVYALGGLLLVVMGIPTLLVGGLSLFGALVVGLLGITGALATFFQTLGILGILVGIAEAWLGFWLLGNYGGKLGHRIIGVAALLSAIACIILAVITGLPTGFLATFVFLVIMLVFLIIMDWGFDSEFATKYMKSVPILGKVAVGAVRLTLPKK